MNEDRINAAVREGIDSCIKSAVVLVCIAEYVIRLIDDQKWTRTDADEVGRRMIKALRERPEGNGIA